MSIRSRRAQSSAARALAVLGLALVLAGVSACAIPRRPAPVSPPRGAPDGQLSRTPERIPFHPGPKLYRVRAGDTLYAIARRLDTTVEVLQRRNPGLDPRRLQVGMLLRVPWSKPPIRNVRRGSTSPTPAVAGGAP